MGTSVLSIGILNLSGAVTKHQLWTMLTSSGTTFARLGDGTRVIVHGVDRDGCSGSCFSVRIQYRGGSMGTVALRTVD